MAVKGVGIDSAFLLACRQIYCEARIVFYANEIFLFKQSWHLDQFWNSLRPDSACLVRPIKVDMDPAEAIEYLGSGNHTKALKLPLEGKG